MGSLAGCRGGATRPGSHTIRHYDRLFEAVDRLDVIQYAVRRNDAAGGVPDRVRHPMDAPRPDDLEIPPKRLRHPLLLGVQRLAPARLVDEVEQPIPVHLGYPLLRAVVGETLLVLGRPPRDGELLPDDPRDTYRHATVTG